MKTIALDFESYYDKECSIKKLGPLGYFSHPSFDAYMVSVVSDDGTTFVGHPKDFDWSLLENSIILSHNASFDHTLYQYGVSQKWWPEVEYASWHCTADMCAALGLPRSLKGASAEVFNETISKSTRDNMSGKRWEDMDEDFKQEVSEYALKDSEWCLKLWQELSGRWSEQEREISRVNRKISQRGLPLDQNALKEAQETISRELFETEQAIPWNGDRPLLSRKAFDEECIKMGIEPPASLAQTDVDAQKWIKQHGHHYRWIYAVTNWRRINTIKKKLASFDVATMPDGRYYGGLMYYGAHCVTAGHQVLTKQGWINIEEWEGGEIAQWDENTGSIVFDEAESNSFINEQPLYELDSPFIKGVFTAGHTMPRMLGERVKPTPCENLVDKCITKLPTSGNYVNEEGSLGPIEMRLLVATQADGHWPKVTQSGYCVTFTLRKQRKIERLEMLLHKAGISFEKQNFPCCPTQYRITIKKNDLPSWWVPERKVFGPWVLEATSEGLEAAAEELEYWDSHTDSHDKEFCSVDNDNVTWAQIIIHLTGNMSMPRKARKAVKNKKECYRMGFREKGFSYAYRKHWKKVDHEKTVYCPTTKTGYWVYRYKGRVGITGNTGRFSGSGGNLNLQNLSREEMFGVNMRRLIHAPKGRKLVVVDLSQIEVRTLCWLAGDKEMLDTIAKSDDIYEAFAIKFGLWSVDKGSMEQDPALRHAVKAAVLGSGYGSGPDKVAAMYNLPLKDAERMVSIYRRTMKKVTSYWSKIKQATRTAHATGSELVFELPSGSTLNYGKLKMMRTAKGTQYVATPIRNGKRQPLKIWYGLQVENLSQKLARDVFCDHMVKLDQAGYEVILHVHDEFVVECDEEKAEKVLAGVTRIMSTAPEWVKDLPLSAKGKIMNYYQK